MAELTLTEEERRSPTFLEWDNESLGLAVRKIAVMLNDGHGAGPSRLQRRQSS